MKTLLRILYSLSTIAVSLVFILAGIRLMNIGLLNSSRAAGAFTVAIGGWSCIMGIYFVGEPVCEVVRRFYIREKEKQRGL